MGNNPPTNDPKSIWQNQPEETSKVTLILIRKMARDMRTKNRKEVLGLAVTHLAFIAISVLFIARSPLVGQKVALAVDICWFLAGVWVYQRGMWSPPLPGDAGFEAGIAFYRREIQRRSSLFKLSRWLVWGLGPLLLFLGAIIIPFLGMILNADPTLLRKTIPFFAMLALWAIAVLILRARGKRALAREIDELKEIEQEK